MATATATPNTKKASKLLDRYAELAELKAQAHDAYKHAVAPLEDEMTTLKGKLEVWADENPEAFGGKKSLALEAGSFGWKLGLKAVKFPLDGPEDIKDRYFAAVKKELPSAIVESVDSKKVVGAIDHFPLLAKALGKLAITVGQEDGFYITPKK